MWTPLLLLQSSGETNIGLSCIEPSWADAPVRPVAPSARSAIAANDIFLDMIDLATPSLGVMLIPYGPFAKRHSE